MYDLLLKGGLVVDGTRGKPYIANVAIQNGKIACITDQLPEAAKVLDVTGLAVTPGFIDPHSHADEAHLHAYIPESQVMQGVTTEIVGNCGSGVLPATPERREELDRYMREKKGCDAFGSITDYVAAVDRGAVIHHGVLVGHSTLRLAVMGFVNRAPDEREMEQLKDLLDRELSRGAFGMSLGLIYPPSAFSAREELVELAKVIKKHDGILAVHMRNEGPRIFEAVDEMIDIAEKSGVHIEISHLKLMGKPQWGKSAQLLKKLTEARARGINITCDQYPFIASSTGMSALVPHWAHEGGSVAMVKRLEAREGSIMEQIAQEMDNRGGPEAVLVVKAGRHNDQWNAKTVAQIAGELGLDAVETVRHVLITCGGAASCVYFSMYREDMLNIMGQLFICVGSDGGSVSLDKSITNYVPHPRYYSAFTQFFQTVREEGLMPLEDAVYKVTALPASILGIRDRGVLKEGMAADIAVFDPQTIGSRSDFLESRVASVGVHHVIVDGVLALENGKITGQRPGKVLLKK